MHLNKLFNIKNMPGLYQATGKIKGGFMVESLTDGTRFPVTNGNGVDAYCLSEIKLPCFDAEDAEKDKDLPLIEVFQKMYAYHLQPVGVKEEVSVIKSYFKAVVPGMKQHRVFSGDMKKIITWYNLLNGKVDFSIDQNKQQAA